MKLSVVGADDASAPIESFTDLPADVEAVAHRIVHGGSRYRDAVVIDAGAEHELAVLAELAPLHNRRALATVAAAHRALPHLPHVAVFDTAFHGTIPEHAWTYGLPRRWRDEWGIRRYGFHGLSVQWAAEQVAAARLVVCHLGGGCSVTAVRDGRSVDTTMGFTPLEGVPMATRSGSIDAAIVLHLLRAGVLDADDIEGVLEHESGLLGISGISARVEALEASDEPAARLALEVFAYRVATAVGSMAVALGGLDALVFTAGVGEGSAWVRDAVCDRLGFLGVGPPEHRVEVVVLHAQEDVVAARAARALLSR
jgi:acetate kinase